MTQGSQFKHTILEILAKSGERLDSFIVRVKGSDSSSSTPSRASQTSEPNRDLDERDVDEWLNDYSAILTWPDEELGEDPSCLLDIVLVPISHHFLCNYRQERIRTGG